MTFKLTATISHKSFGTPVVKEIYYHGDSFESVLDQIETLSQHKFNLKMFRRTAFKDARGVKHKWKIELMKEEIQ